MQTATPTPASAEERLIVAAPDLLAACEQALLMFDACRLSIADHVAVIHAARAALIAAVAKAKGD